jgi:hypothetical protein
VLNLNEGYIPRLELAMTVTTFSIMHSFNKAQTNSATQIDIHKLFIIIKFIVEDSFVLIRPSFS